VEAYLRLGIDMPTAVEKTDESLGLLAVDDPTPAASAVPGTADRPPERVPTAAENDRALRELQQMMGGAVGR
jgi:hypothetical protein